MACIAEFHAPPGASRLAVLVPLMEHPERAMPLRTLADTAHADADDARRELDELIRLGLAMEMSTDAGATLYRLSHNPTAHRVAAEFRRNRALFGAATTALCDALLRGTTRAARQPPHPSPAGAGGPSPRGATPSKASARL